MIAYLANGILVCFLYILLYRLIFGVRFSTKIIRYLILAILILSFNSLYYLFAYDFVHSEIPGVISSICIPLLLCDRNKFATIFYAPITVVMLITLGTFIQNIINMINEFYHVPIGDGIAKKLFTGVCLICIVSLIYFFIRRKGDIQPLHFNIWLFAALLLGVGSAFLLNTFSQSLIDRNLIHASEMYIVNLLSSIVAILYTFVIIEYSRTSKAKEKLEKDKLEYELLAQKQNEQINSTILKKTELQKFRHDYRAHLTFIQGLLNDNKTTEALKYLSELTKKGNLSDIFHYTGIPALDYVIDEYRTFSDENNIEWFFTGSFPYYENTDYFPLCTVFSNLLRNATEACTHVTEKRFIHTSINSIGRFYSVEISNSCLPGADSSQTSKSDKENHGFGIRNVIDTVSACSGYYEAQAIGSVFSTTVTLILEGNSGGKNESQ